MKIVVYAICKNEARFVDRWMDSMGGRTGWWCWTPAPPTTPWPG